MTDHELLELAAKSCGELTPSWYGNSDYMDGVLSRWNPLTDDGDALRLAVKLTLEIDVCLTGIAVRTATGIKVLIRSTIPVIMPVDAINDIIKAIWALSARIAG